MEKKRYQSVDWNINYREHPEQYVIGRGEFGVMKYQPYKTELLPLWRYKDEEVAKKAASEIYDAFLEYLDKGDFPGADMARKYLRMGYTRAMRYAKYPGGTKYDARGRERPACIWAAPEKRQAALVYKTYWDKARQHKAYQRMYRKHKNSDDEDA